jgi:hypothetical protein
MWNVAGVERHGLKSLRDAAALSASKFFPDAARIAFALLSVIHPSTGTRFSASGDGTSNCSTE